ncbi:MAG TPA: hypothetical protein V6C97_36600 [Oculatellaceae cyanobacterium]
MQRIQDKYGSDKFQVLALSVDRGYDMAPELAASMNTRRMHKQHVDWPNVLLPHGFDDTQSRFNLDGYGLTLIGPDGFVMGADMRADDVETLVGELLDSHHS